MTSISRLAVIMICAIVTTSVAHAVECRDPGVPKGESRSRVRVLSHIKAPYFYFRSFDYNFVVVVTPDSLRAELEVEASGGNKEAGELRDLVGRELPLSQNSDLFRFVLDDAYRLSFIQRLMVIFLARGDAAVFDAETGEFVPAIEVEQSNSTLARGRTFYGPHRVVLLRSLDCVSN